MFYRFNMKNLSIPKWVDGEDNFMKLYKEFKESLLNGNALKFLKEKIFDPNNVQYTDYYDFLEVINPKDNKVYLFLDYDFDDLYEWDDPDLILIDILEYAAEKIDESIEKNKEFELEQYRAYIIGKNGILVLYYNTYFYEYEILCFTNKKRMCELDEYAFTKFLKGLTKNGIIKNN